jgi:hypothetical protein
MPCNAGNSDYANSVYGGQDQQTAAPGQGNLIQMHNPAGLTGGSTTPLHIGGRKGKKSPRRRGGLGLGQFLVPAGLVLANNYTYKRLRGKKGVRSARRGRGFRPFSRYLSGGNEPMVKMGGNENAIAPLVKMGGTHSSNVGSAPSVTGYSGQSSLSPALVGGEGPIPEGGIPPNQVGGSTLVDLAVPAGLVYANDRYYNRKARGNTNGRRPKRGIRRTRGRRVRG